MAEVRRFLPVYDPSHAFFKADKPMAQGVAVLGGAYYSYFKYQMHLASQNALGVYKEACREFEKEFGRKYDTIEEYRLDDAEYVLVMTNSFSTLGKAAVNRARDQGIKAGLLRPRLLRPFPEEDIRNALKGKKSVAVIDQNISVGKGGILYSEIASCLYNEKHRPFLMSFIGGLGGKNISPEEFAFIFDQLARGEEAEVETPHLLYTQQEWEEMQKLKEIAGKE